MTRSQRHEGTAAAVAHSGVGNVAAGSVPAGAATSKLFFKSVRFSTAHIYGNEMNDEMSETKWGRGN